MTSAKFTNLDQLPLFIFVVSMMIVSLFGNGITCFIYGYKLRQTVTRNFIFALSVIDLISCVLCMPLEIYIVATFITFKYSALCKFSRYVTYVSHSSTSLILLAIAWDRYYKVCRPLKTFFNVQKSRLYCTVILVFSFLFAWPAIALYGTNYLSAINGSTCSIAEDMVATPYPILFFGIYSSSFLFIAISMIVLYGRIIKQIKVLKKGQDLRRSRETIRRSTDTCEAKTPNGTQCMGISKVSKNEQQRVQQQPSHKNERGGSSAYFSSSSYAEDRLGSSDGGIIGVENISENPATKNTKDGFRVPDNNEDDLEVKFRPHLIGQQLEDKSRPGKKSSIELSESNTPQPEHSKTPILSDIETQTPEKQKVHHKRKHRKANIPTISVENTDSEHKRHDKQLPMCAINPLMLYQDDLSLRMESETSGHGTLTDSEDERNNEPQGSRFSLRRKKGSLSGHKSTSETAPTTSVINTNSKAQLSVPKVLKSVYRPGKTTRMLLTVTVCFFASFLPFFTIVIYRKYVGVEYFFTMDHARFVAIGIFIRSYLVSNAVNPIIYGFLNNNFRSQVKKLLQGKLHSTKSKYNPNTQTIQST